MRGLDQFTKDINELVPTIFKTSEAKDSVTINMSDFAKLIGRLENSKLWKELPKNCTISYNQQEF